MAMTKKELKKYYKSQEKEAAKIEMVSKLAKRKKEGKYFPKNVDGTKATDTRAALNTFRVQKSIDKDLKKGGRDIDLISDRRLASKEGSMRTGGLSTGQKKLAAKAPPRNKIDGKDFKVLRAEKAKGRGMGLQDEKVQPGKVMKARKGKSAMVPLKKGYSKTLGVFPTINKVKPSVGGSGSGMGKGTDKVSTKKAEDFMKRRKQLGGGKLKALTRVMGSRAALLGLVGAGAVADRVDDGAGRRVRAERTGRTPAAARAG